MSARPRCDLSIVSPVYQAEACVPELCERISQAVQGLGISYEIVLVEDGSRDYSWGAIVDESRKRPDIVRGFRLSRNFGQHAAITAGLTFAQGQHVIVMDCDLQDPPEAIPQLYRMAVNERRDIILTRSRQRHTTIWASAGSKAFHRLMDLLSGEHLDPGIRSLSILSRAAISSFLQVRDYHRHYLSILSILGYQPRTIELRSETRFAGRSSYTFLKRFAHAIDGITAHSTRLLYLAIYLGLTYGLGALVFLVYVVYTALTAAHGVPGWASAITVALLTGSVLCMLLGIIGIYIGKIFYEVKGRPIFFISEATNADSRKLAEAALLAGRTESAGR
jgi:polyisoprenyl-phosphate glycosyltransferase